MKESFTIGEISSLLGLTSHTLRYYDKIGLIRPAETNAQTGYRKYSYEQVFALERIRYLREALECKIILEGCKKNLFDPIIPYLDDLIARQRAYINASAFELAFQLDTEFHRIFYNLTHKEFVLSHTGESDIHYLRARLVALRYDDPTALPLQHQAIVDALVAHDEKGLQEAILLHLNNINVTYATRLPDSEKWMFTNGEFV